LRKSSPEDLRNALQAVFHKLGIDPDKVTAAAPHGPGNAVFDLAFELIDPDGPEGFQPPAGIRLSWTERQLGDYDQNGEVGISDLTPLGVNFGESVAYDPLETHDGIPHWPEGDPDAAGGLNWRLARIDGDGNGEFNIADVTPIGLNWKSTISGYRIYRRHESVGEAELLPNPQNASLPYSIGRPAPNPNAAPRYFFTDSPQADGIYQYFVVPFHEADNDEGSSSNVVEVGYNTVIPENVSPSAVLTAEPATGVMPLAVSFDASSSADPDGSLVRYEIDFDGDGIFDSENSTDTGFAHIYEGLASYQATMRVTDNRGATDSASATITVTLPPNHAPLPVFTVEAAPGGSLDEEVPLEVIFDPSQSSDPDGHGLLCHWDFDGDGTVDELRSSTEPFNYTYAEAGEMVPQLLLKDQVPVGSLSAEVSYDGVIHARANQPPVAVLDASPTSGDTPLFVEFDASQSYDPSGGGSIVYYEWDLDGNRIYEHGGWNLSNITYTYTQARPFVLATVRVTDNGGVTATDSVVIELPYVAGWIQTRVDPLGSAGIDLSMALINGHPAVAYRQFAVGLFFCRAGDPLGATWGNVVAVDTKFTGWPEHYGNGYTPSLIESAGHPAIAHLEDSAVIHYLDSRIQVEYVRANDPLGEYWGESTVIADHLQNLSGAVSAAIISGQPAICWSDTELQQILYLRSTDELGQEWPHTAATVRTGSSYQTAMIDLGGIPGIAAGYFYRASDAAGSAWEESISSLKGFPRLAIADGYPVAVGLSQVAFTDYYDLYYSRANDPEGVSWSSQLLSGDVAVNKGAGLGIVDGKPAIAFVDRTNSRLVYRLADDAQGNNWGAEETVLESVTGSEAGYVQLMGVGEGGAQPLIVFRRYEASISNQRGLFALVYFPPQE
jgi:PKD repeat protein